MNALPNLAATVSTASLDYSVFKKAMTNACKVVERKNTIPVLDTVLIKATRGGALITGTDLDLSTTTFVPGEVSPDFVAIVNAHKLKATMDKVKDSATINFSQEGESLAASIGKLRLSLKQPHEEKDFPDEASFRSEVAASNCSFVLPSSLLANILGKIKFAISAEETRYYLNGVFMHVNEYRKKLTFVTTDGHRLARYEVDVPAGAGAMHEDGVIIPRKTVTELLRLVKRKDCPADTLVRVTKTGVSFTVGEDEVLASKTIDGTFPDYQRVIPTQNSRKIAVHTGPFIDAVKQASAVMTEQSKPVKLAFHPERLVFSCSDPEFGTASTEIRVDNDDTFEVGFNAGYLLEILGQLEGGAMLELEDPGTPGVIKDGALDGLTYALMPLRV